MALRKIGKYYYTYFRDENGKLRTLATGQTVEAEARKIDRANLSKVRSRRQRKTVLRFCSPEEAEKIRKTESESALPPEDRTAHRRGTIRLDKMFETACKYRSLSPNSHRNAMNRFIEKTGLTFADQVTPEIALQYLREEYGSGNGKSFNNNRTYLNTIFKLCLIESGLKESPFEKIINMRVTGVGSYRPITEEEFVRLFDAAKEPWKTALLMSWHTGLRPNDCFTLKWSELIDGWIVRKPGKTARYNRAVEIPIHTELQEHLDTLPRPDDPDQPILKPFLSPRFKRIAGGRCVEIKNLFKSQGVLDNQHGKASFYSIRATFITRCDEAGIPRHATRGMVGQVKDKTTDKYSQDRETPKLILRFPSVCKKVCKN